MTFENKTVTEIRDGVKQRKFKAVDVIDSYLSRISSVEPKIDAFISILSDYARNKAKEIDAKADADQPLGPLAGVPVAIKDNMCTTFAKTTCGSKILSNYLPPYNACVVERLEQADAIIIGKTNLDEFAMGSSTENSGFKITKNPWNLECVPGGSSGGSGAAVAARMATVALGSDTGGSIRLPASFCGVCGMKPTYGRVSRYGLVAYGSSLDQIGPFGLNVRDIAETLNVICGHDPRDSTSIPESFAKTVDFVQELEKPITGLKIGIVREYQSQGGLDSDVEKAMQNTIEVFKKLGATIVEVNLPHTQYAVACYYLLATAEASSNLARYDGVHYGHRTENPSDYLDVYFSSRAEGFGDEVKRRIMLGTYALSAGYYDAYYLKALKVRTLIKNDFEKAFQEADIILAPTSPTPAFKIGEKTADPLTMYLSDIFTISVNLAGIPGISIPCGFSSQKMPIGVQLLGRHLDEAAILRAGHHFQTQTDFHHQIPTIA